MEAMQTQKPEDMQAEQAKWMAWAQNCGDHLVEMGSPLYNGRTLTPGGIKDSASPVTGYSVLQAESREAAEKMLEEHPHLTWIEGCTIELMECMEMGGN